MTHNVSVSSWLACVLFLICAGVWGRLIWRSGARLPSSLAIAALIAASFLSFYHSIPDVSLLIIALCDAFPASLRDWTRIQKLICILLVLMMLPQRSIFCISRSSPQCVHSQGVVVGSLLHAQYGLAPARPEYCVNSADA